MCRRTAPAATPVKVATIERTIMREAGTCTDGTTAWQQVGTASVYRTKTTAETGQALQLDEGEPLFGIDRLLINPDTGTHALHRTLIPCSTAEGTEPADTPDAEPDQIYPILAAAGHELT